MRSFVEGSGGGGGQYPHAYLIASEEIDVRVAPGDKSLNHDRFATD